MVKTLELEIVEGAGFDPGLDHAVDAAAHHDLVGLGFAAEAGGEVGDAADRGIFQALLEADLAWYEEDIPIQAFTFETSPELEAGTELTVQLIATWQACNAEVCTPPETRTWELTLPVAESGTRRGQLYGWQGW